MVSDNAEDVITDCNHSIGEHNMISDRYAGDLPGDPMNSVACPSVTNQAALVDTRQAPSSPTCLVRKLSI